MEEIIEYKPDFSIKIFGNNCIVDCTNNNNLPIKKTIKLESLLKAFQNTDTNIESPLLPLNCIRYRELGSTVSVVLYHGPRTFTATCSGQTFENCIRPGIIIKYILNVDTDYNGKKYTINDTRCYGVIDDSVLFGNKTQLYGLPFPNISSEGWVCWGSNSVAGEIRALTGLGVFVDRLFNSPFNSHVFHNSLLKAYGIQVPTDLFTFIQNKNKFPTELLENLGANWNLGML